MPRGKRATIPPSVEKETPPALRVLFCLRQRCFYCIVISGDSEPAGSITLNSVNWFRELIASHHLYVYGFRIPLRTLLPSKSAGKLTSIVAPCRLEPRRKNSVSHNKRNMRGKSKDFSLSEIHQRDGAFARKLLCANAS